MNKVFPLALLMGGIVLMILGLSAPNLIGSDVSRLFTDSTTDKTLWLLLSGIGATVVGLTLAFRGSKQL